MKIPQECLKRHDEIYKGQQLNRAMAKKSPEKWKTWGNVFDNFTIVTIHKIIDKGIINGLVGPLKIGKESNVFVAKIDGRSIIVKIYRLETCDFKKMYDYIKYDPRYSSLHKRRRLIIFSWVQRELRNLHIARVAGLRVPTPIHASNNVLIEEFIGDDSKNQDGAAPQLKDQIPEDPEKFYRQVKVMIKKLLKAKLVHADLSQFNILNNDEKPVFIDFSQSTPIDNPRAKEYFLNDAKNITNFFTKIGVECQMREYEEMWDECVTSQSF